MKEDLLLLLTHALRFMFCAVVVLLLMVAIYLDIHLLGSAATELAMSERSVTEVTQEILLLIIVAIYAYVSWENKKMRPALVLVGGFFACMFLREMDYWFGLAGLHWLPPVVAVAALCIFYAAKRPEATVSGLARFVEMQHFAALMNGLLTVLVFSRLFGMSAVWNSLLGNDFPRWVKIFAEEGVELLGYSQCFLATFFYARLERREKQHHSAEAFTPLTASEATERMTS